MYQGLKILNETPPADVSSFGKKPVFFDHALHTLPMFSDDGLIELLDTYPRDAFNTYTMRDDGTGKDSFQHVDPGTLSGEDIYRAVEAGRIWINLRRVNDHIPAYAELCDAMFGELEDQVHGLKTIKRDLGVLISSPKAEVFYHLDIPLVTLWQIRGQKDFWVYPTGHPFAADKDVEAIVLRETEEEITYDVGFDANAIKTTLKPGMMASWPQTAPHRILNQDCVNVSLSCEYMTLPGIIHANALYANGVLRRRFGANPVIARDNVATKVMKAGLARMMKLGGGRNAFVKEHVEPSFVIDPAERFGVRNIPASTA